jgi:hypothetical protein
MLIDIRQYEKDQAEHRKAGSESSDVDGRFKMFDIDNIYNENSVRVESDLYRTFLSQENQWIIQSGLRSRVLAMSNNRYAIEEQNPILIMNVMKFVFLKNQYQNQTQNSVGALNEDVLHYCAPYIYGQSVEYEHYLRNLPKRALIDPLDPAMVVDRSYKQLLNVMF